MQRKRRRYFWLLGTAMILAWIAWLVLTVEEETSEGKAAVVNGSVIAQEDLDREIIRVQKQLTSMGKSFDYSQLPAIKKEILEGLINRELLYQESQAKGIKVEEVAINEKLKTFEERFSSEDEFKSALIKMNLSEGAIKSQIKRELAIGQFIDKQFIQKATVSIEETRAYYDNHKDSFKQPEQVRASHIFIKIDLQADDSQKAAARKKIEVIKQKLKDGEDFTALAQEFSEDPSGAKGGDLGYFSRGQMVKALEEAAFALMLGEVSDVVETSFGYHLIRVIEKKPETRIPYEDIKDKIQEHLRKKKVVEQLDQLDRYIEELKRKAKVERFLIETSK